MSSSEAFSNYIIEKFLVGTTYLTTDSSIFESMHFMYSFFILKEISLDLSLNKSFI